MDLAASLSQSLQRDLADRDELLAKGKQQQLKKNDNARCFVFTLFVAC